jgi:glutamyl-Q tRNA(Asp) synthetase
MPSNAPYRGRFAPSPTGPLHFGSLVAAVASYLQAHAQSGSWLVRIEDLDPPREPPGSTELILRALDIHGFEYSEPVYQSARLEHYQAVLDQLINDGLAYPCSCSRKHLQATAPRGRNGIIYPGTCRDGLPTHSGPATAIRMRTNDHHTSYPDILQGQQSAHLESDIGDFLLRRGDGLFSYHLAVVVDDHDQQITEVVRGTDLIDSSFPQIALIRALNFVPPDYMHIPVALNAHGQKLSKQSHAPPLNLEKPEENIYKSLKFLKQNPPEELKSARLNQLWDWGQKHWRPQNLAGQISGAL